MPLIPILLAVGLGIGLLAASKGAGAASSATASGMPPTLLDAIVNAIASRDVGVMRAVALKVQANGYPQQAADLNRTADEVQAENDVLRATAKVMTPAQAVEQIAQQQQNAAATAAAAAAPVAPGQPASEQQQLAAEVAKNLLNTAPGRENRTLIVKFQKQEGLTQDGKYGPKTAATLVKYGIVPPVPRAWPKGAEVTARQAFAAMLTQQANVDKVRAEEWLQGAALAMKGKAA